MPKVVGFLLLVVVLGGGLAYLINHASLPTNIASKASNPFATNNVLTRLSPPDATSSSQQQKDFEMYVQRTAQNTTSFTLNDKCDANPMVLQIKLGQSVSVANKSGTEHLLSFQGFKFAIDKNFSAAFGTSFITKPGIYTFYCDKEPSPSGALYVVQ